MKNQNLTLVNGFWAINSFSKNFVWIWAVTPIFLPLSEVEWMSRDRNWSEVKTDVLHLTSLRSINEDIFNFDF